MCACRTSHEWPPCARCVLPYPNPITALQVPLARLLLETDSPDGRPRQAGEPEAALRAVPAPAAAGSGAAGGAGQGDRRSLAQRASCPRTCCAAP